MTALIDHRQPPVLLLDSEPGQPHPEGGVVSPLAGLAQALTVVAQAGGEVPCHENDAELWFAERPEDVESAKALCRPCPGRPASTARCNAASPGASGAGSTSSRARSWRASAPAGPPKSIAR